MGYQDRCINFLFHVRKGFSNCLVGLELPDSNGINGLISGIHGLKYIGLITFLLELNNLPICCHLCFKRTHLQGKKRAPSAGLLCIRLSIRLSIWLSIWLSIRLTV